MGFMYCATANVEIAHKGIDGYTHGHSLQIEVWTSTQVDLDEWSKGVQRKLELLEKGPLEDTIGRTFEDVIDYVFKHIKPAEKVVLRLPSRGHAIEQERCGWDAR